MKKLIPIIIFLLLSSMSSFSATIYVDANNGNDNFNGTSASTGSFPNGPKATINAAFGIAQQSDNVVVLAGHYKEIAKVTKNLNMIINGQVLINSIHMASKDKTLNIIGIRIEVKDSLILESGKIDVSTGIQLVLTNACKIVGGNKSSYVDGPISYDIVTSGVKRICFPIGSNHDYRPIEIKLNQLNNLKNTYTAAVRNNSINYSDKSSTINRISKVHFWELTKNGPSKVNNLDITVQYDSASSDDEVFDPEKLKLMHDSASFMVELKSKATTKFEGTVSAHFPREKWGNFTLGNKVTGINSLGHTAPFAIFDVKEGCVFSSVKFSDRSFTTDSLKSWKWDFDYANKGTHTSEKRTPNFTYSTPGIYSVMLTVENSLGEKDSTIKEVEIYAQPSVKFQANNACFGDTVHFTDQTNTSDSLISWNWNINGGTSVLQNLSLVITKPDTTIATLIGENTKGCKDTFSSKIVIFNKPQPAFTVEQICLNDKTLFTSNSTVNNDTIMETKWFINSKLEHSANEYSTVLSKEGVYMVKIATLTSNGCVDSLEKPVTIYAYPTADFGLKQVTGNSNEQCFNSNNFRLEDNTQNSNGTVTFNWSTNDGQTSTLAEPNFKFSNSGTYSIKQIVENDGGCKDSIEQSFKVLPATTIEFTTRIPCFPDSLSFSSKLSHQDDQLKGLEWTMGDGNTVSNSETFQYLYSSKGKYPVKLVMTTAKGCKDSITQDVEIEDRPIAKITSNGSLEFCEGNSITLSASGGQTFTWLPMNVSTKTISVNTSSTIILRVASSNNCFGYDTVQTVANPTPIADAGIDTVVTRGRTIQLNGQGGLDYEWLPNIYLDNNQSYNPICKPTADITYTLTITDDKGCTANDDLNIKVIEPEKIQIVNLVSPNSDGSNDYWDLSDLPELNTCHITIYNKQGVKVFETSDYQNDWYGTYNGEELPEGTYFYYISCTSEKEDFKGTLLLLR